jgi:tetratricopeptide (TPR) repeat protein
MQPEDAVSVSSVPPESEDEAAELRLAGLVEELARGTEKQRWCAARLHEAATHERAGELQQAINALQLAMSQNSDPRIRQERDRIQSRSQKAASGVFRARAITEERANKHKEAADNWRRVLEACPNDVDAAIHAATCLMEIGEVKQAGQFARRAVELDPQSVPAHRLMFRFFRKTGMELNANREREILKKLAKY